MMMMHPRVRINTRPLLPWYPPSPRIAPNCALSHHRQDRLVHNKLHKIHNNNTIHRPRPRRSCLRPWYDQHGKQQRHCRPTIVRPTRPRMRAVRPLFIAGWRRMYKRATIIIQQHRRRGSVPCGPFRPRVNWKANPIGDPMESWSGWCPDSAAPVLVDRRQYHQEHLLILSIHHPLLHLPRVHNHRIIIMICNKSKKIGRPSFSCRMES